MPAPFVALAQAGLKLGQDATNKKKAFDTNIFRLLGSHVTGRQPTDFTTSVTSDSVGTAAKGVQGFFNARQEQAQNQQQTANAAQAQIAQQQQQALQGNIFRSLLGGDQAGLQKTLQGADANTLGGLDFSQFNFGGK